MLNVLSVLGTEVTGVDVPQAAALATIAAESNNVNNVFFSFSFSFLYLSYNLFYKLNFIYLRVIC